MFSSCPPCPHFQRNQLAEVICQFRFPPILSIETREPADFQEAIRQKFPRYAVHKEQLPPRMVGAGGPNARLETQAPVTNYYFVSADSKWKINLTKNFISISTVAYTGWESFAAQFDQPLAEFIRIYQPAFFERIGLRYLNIFSRTALDLEDIPWSALISPSYTGPLSRAGVVDADLSKFSMDCEVILDSSCRARLHSGIAQVKSNVPNAPVDPERKFILDIDTSMPGQTEPRMAAAVLETLHGHATGLFAEALLDPLKDALRPET